MFRYISMVALLFCSCRVYSEDFQITQIKSSNVLYRYWATRHLHKKGNNIITISFEDSLAYVSYKGENRRVLFFQSPHGRYTYYKNKYGLPLIFVWIVLYGTPTSQLLEKAVNRLI